jgi:hypothetical protein
MLLPIPPRVLAVDGVLTPNRTIRGTAISARTGLAYCEIAAGTSGRQTAWRSCALYCPPQSNPAYYPKGHPTPYPGARWFMVGVISPSPYGFKLHAHRSFNPQPAMRATIHGHSQSDLRVLMETILEKWYG